MDNYFSGGKGSKKGAKVQKREGEGEARRRGDLCSV